MDPDSSPLLMVDAIDPNILDRELVDTPRTQCDEALRMLEGEVPQPEVLVSPLDHTNTEDD